MSSCVLISYQTFVGFALETPTTSPYRDGNSGPVSSSGEASPTIFLPLSGDESLGSNPNYTEFPQPDGYLGPIKFQSLGTKVEGNLSVTVPPGVVSTLFSWIYERGNASYVGTCTNETASATVWVQLGGITCKRIIGVKVNSAEFSVQRAQPLIINLSCVGYGEEHISPITFNAPSWWNDAVYGGDSIGLQFPTGTSQKDADSMRWTINNHLDDDPFRLWTSNYPRRLWSRDREIVGATEVDYYSDTEYARFLAGDTGSATAAFAKTIGVTSYTTTFSFPRLRYNAVQGVNAGAQKDRIIRQTIDWKAMRQLDGSNELSWT